MKNRRDFLRNTFGLGAGLAAVPRLFAAPTQASGESMDMEHMSHATQRNSGIVSVETPDVPERLWCSYPDCHCEREYGGVCQYKYPTQSAKDQSPASLMA